MLTKEEREALGLPAPTNGTEMYLSANVAVTRRLADFFEAAVAADAASTGLRSLAPAAQAFADAARAPIPLREPEPGSAVTVTAVPKVLPAIGPRRSGNKKGQS